MTVKEYAQKILADHGCNEHSYWGTDGEQVVSDLKEAYPAGMDHPYVDVANAILELSKPEPIKRAPWQMLFDNEECCDGIGFESFEAAKDDAIETLIKWMIWDREEWKAGPFDPTEDELDRYNYMICNCSVEVRKYDPETDEYEEYWGPSYEDEEEIGWKELTMEDIQKEKETYEAGLTSTGDSDTLAPKE